MLRRHAHKASPKGWLIRGTLCIRRQARVAMVAISLCD